MADALLFGNLFAERKERVYRERIEMADMSETQIRSRFRFRRETIIFISNLLRNDLERPVNKKKSVHFCGNAGKFFTFHFQKTLLKFVSFRLLHKY